MTIYGPISRRISAALRTLSASWALCLAAVLVSILAGVAVPVVNPMLLFGAFAAAGALGLIVVKGQKVFVGYLIFLLLGYLVLGKGFAYVGAAPIFVAEVGLLLAAGTAAVVYLLSETQLWVRLFRPEVGVLLIFIAWQALCTFPYLGIYGIDALRDAAVWGYAAFALFILLLVPKASVERLFVLYGKALPYVLAWLLVAWVIVNMEILTIYLPGSPVSLVHMKSGDVGVHLAGAAAFMLLRLDLRSRMWPTATLWLLWGLWVLNWVLWGASNRGGMLSALIGVSVVLLWRPRTRWYRPLAIVILALVILVNVDLSGYDFSKRFTERTGASLSGQQLIDNAASTFGNETSSDSSLEGTVEWRTSWWEKIIGYTFGGEYFWMGKGYGINLATSDGYQMFEDEALRSPHSNVMTILARSGVPGLVLWALFLAVFGATLVRRTFVGRTGDYQEAKYALWLLAYWLAFLFNGSVDVFLEGPMGGVWFWSVVGMALVYFPRKTYSSMMKRGVPRPTLEYRQR